MSGGRTHRSARTFLIILAIISAAAVRLYGIHFGRGALTARPDEELIRAAAWHALTGDLNPHYAVWGHLFHYLYVVAGYAVVTWQWFVRGGTDWWGAVAGALQDGSAHFLLGRYISAAAGTATVWAVYRLTRRISRSRLAAVSAAWVMALLFLHVRDSHFATCDVLLSLMCTLALWTLAAERGTRLAAFMSAAALATKLSAAPVVAAGVLDIFLRRGRSWTRVLWQAMAYVATTLLFWVALQPYLWLDLPQTHFGLLKDLLNPERQPMREGIRWENALLIARYYIPQGVGWGPAIAAVFGFGWLLARRGKERPVWLLMCYAAVSAGLLLSVRRIFLRYLDPLLPVVAVSAGIGMAVVAGSLSRQRFIRRKLGLIGALSLVMLAALGPEAVRAVQLGRLLSRPDTRALARDWLAGEAARLGRPIKVYWSGFGQIAAHLTAPWVDPPEAHRQQLLAMWRLRGEPEPLLRALDERLGDGRVEVVAWEPEGPFSPPVSGLRAYGGPSLRLTLPRSLARWDRWLREMGVLRPFQPRLFVVRLAIVARCSGPLERVQPLLENADYVVVTGMPYSMAGRRLAEKVAERYELAAHFGPGPKSHRATYDMGDAWWVPNRRLSWAERPGPQIWIFRNRAAVYGTRRAQGAVAGDASTGK